MSVTPLLSVGFLIKKNLKIMADRLIRQTQL